MQTKGKKDVDPPYLMIGLGPAGEWPRDLSFLELLLDLDAAILLSNAPHENRISPQLREHFIEVKPGTVPRPGKFYCPPSGHSLLLVGEELQLGTAHSPSSSINALLSSIAAEKEKSSAGIVLSSGTDVNPPGLLMILEAGGFGRLLEGSAPAERFSKDWVELVENLEQWVRSGQLISKEEIGQQSIDRHNLLRSSQLVQSVFNATSIGVSITDEKGMFVELNNAFCRIYGYSRDELIGEHFSNILPLEHREDRQRLHEQIINGGKDHPGELQVITKNGQRVWVFLTGQRVQLGDGKYYKVTTIRDISKEKEMESLLLETNEIAQLGGWEYKLNSDELTFTGIAGDILNLTAPGPISSKAALDRVKEGEHKDSLLEALPEVIKKGTPFDERIPMLSKQEREVWVRLIIRPVQVLGWTQKLRGVIQDVTDQKLLEDRFQLISQNLPGVVLRYHLLPDGSDRLDYVRGKTYELWGISGKEAMGNNDRIWENYAEEDLSKHKQSIRESAESLSQWKQEWKYRHPEKGTRWQRGVGNPVRLADGSYVWDTIILDITQEKRAERIVRQNEFRLRSFFNQLSGVSVQGYTSRGEVLFWNRGSEKLFGYTAEEAIGHQIQDLVIPEALKEDVERVLRKMQETGKPYPAAEIELVDKAGEKVPVFSNHAIIEIPGKDPELFRIDIDLREQKQTEQELQQAMASLKERVKEQRCLYNISSLDPQKQSECEFVEECLDTIAQGFQRPELTKIRIQCEEKTTQSPGFEDTVSRISAKRKGEGKFQLHIEVGLLQDQDDPSFLKEEKQLLEAVCEQLFLKISQNRAAVLVAQKQRALQRIMDQSLDMICTSRDGQLLTMSKACEQILGYQPEEMIGKNFRDFVVEEDKDATTSVAKNLKEEKVLNFFENRWRHKDGHLVPLYWSATWDEEEQLIYASAKDATELKKAEEKLRQSEEKFRQLIAGITDIITIIDQQGVVLFHSPSIIDVLGYHPEELQGSSVFDILYPEDFDLVEQRIRETAVAPGPGPKVQFRMLHKNGEYVHLEARGNNQLDNPAIGGIIISSRDISEILQYQHSLRESQEKYKTLYEGSPLPKLIIRGEDLMILDSNQVAANTFNIESGVQLDTFFQELENGSTLHEFKEKIGQIDLQKETVDLGTFTLNLTQFKNVRLEVWGHRVLFGKSEAVILDCIDVTEKERAFLELSKKEANLKAAHKVALLGFWEYNLESEKLEWSEEMFSLYGIQPEEFSGRIEDFIQLVHPDDLDELMEARKPALRGEEDLNHSHRIITPKGEIKWILQRASLLEEEGAAPRFIGIAQDVTQELEIQERIRQSESRHRALVESQTNYVIRTDLEGKYTYYNNKFYEDFGWLHKKENLIGEDSLASIMDHSVKEVERAVEKCFENPETSVQVEIDKPRPNGGIRTTLWEFVALTDSTGAPSEIQCVGIDISRRKELEELLDQATNLAKIGGWAVNMVTGEVNLSKMTRQIHEIPDDFELEMDTALQFLRDEEAKAKLYQAGEKLFNEGVPFDLELPIYTYRNNRKWIRVIAQGRFRDGTCIEISGSFQDIHDRKSAEIALEESNRRLQDYKTALDAAAQIAITDEKGMVTEVNQKTVDASGFERSDLIGKKMGVMGASDQQPELYSDMWQTIADGKIWRGEFKNKKKGGPYYWVDTTIVPFLDENDNPFQYLSIQFEITEKKKAEEAVKIALQQRDEVLKSISDGFFVLNSNWEITYFNLAAERFLGKDKEEVLDRPFNEAFPEEQENGLNAEFKKAWKEKESQSFEYLHTISRKWFEFSCYPSADQMSIYFKDVTDRHEAVEELQRSNQRFEKISEAAKDVIWDYDLMNDTLKLGKGYRKLFGYEIPAPENGPDHWSSRIHPKDRQAVLQSLNTARQDPKETLWQAEYRFLKANGEYASVIDKGHFIRDENGIAFQMVGAIQDLTDIRENELELKKLNRTLQQYTKKLEISNQELEEFAYVASHDLQEPLRMITSFLHQLEKRYGDRLDERAEKYIYFATDAAQRMRQIILDLLDYSRVGRRDGKREPVDVEKLVSEVRRLYDKQIREKKATIEYEDLPVIEAPVSPLRQLFSNLISNGLKYQKPDIKPVIRLWAEELDTHWKFAVQDNGIGIPEEYRNKVFVIFQRLHNREEYSGTGIGLAICQKIVKNLGGEIWIESGENKGTTFFFTIAKEAEDESE